VPSLVSKYTIVSEGSAGFATSKTASTMPARGSDAAVSEMARPTASSSRIVPTAGPVTLALTALPRVTVKVSSLSLSRSPITGTLMVREVAPGGKLKVPVEAT
jgi:hypothetical protein